MIVRRSGGGGTRGARQTVYSSYLQERVRALSSTREHPAYRAEVPRIEAPGALRFATEIVAWVATPWALAAHSPVLAGVALLLLIGLPTVFVTPGDKVKVVVPVSG